MPFRLCNALETFERLMEKMLVDNPHLRCMVYLDDLLMHSRNFSNTIANLHKVFLVIRKANLRLHPGKCHLLRRETAFLGHVISKAGVTMDVPKVAAVKDWPTPTNLQQLCSFLGLASYYQWFVKDFATIASPLHELTKKGRTFKWDMDFERALATASVLDYPDLKRAFILDTFCHGLTMLCIYHSAQSFDVTVSTLTNRHRRRECGAAQQFCIVEVSTMTLQCRS